MSLDQLPNELIAHVGSFLDYKDNQQLGMVNRRIHAVLARDRLDKPKANFLGFVKESTRRMGCHVQFTDITSENPSKIANIELDNELTTRSTEVLNWINKFNAIEHLELHYIRLQDNDGWEDIVAKIRSVGLEDCEIAMSKEVFMKFLKMFEIVTIGDGCIMDLGYITDEFFVELARNGTTVHCWNIDIKQLVDVTDATLDALSSRRIPDKLCLTGLITGITFTRVKKMIEDALKTGMAVISYDFGYLKSDQYNEAHRFMSKEFEGWAEGFDRSLWFYPLNYKDCKAYTIRSEDLYFYINFSVYKREELQQNDNGEAQFGDESDDEAVNFLENLEI